MLKPVAALTLALALVLAAPAVAEDAGVAAIRAELAQVPEGRKFRPERAHLFLKLGRAQLLAGNYRGAEAAAGEALALGEKMGRERTEQEALMIRGDARLYLALYDAALGDYQRALELAGREQRLKGEALWRLGEHARYRRDAGAARGFYREAGEMFSQAGDAAGRAKVSFSLAKMSHIGENFEDALSGYLEAAELFSRAGDGYRAGLATLSGGAVLRLLDRPEDARERFARAAGLFSGMGLVRPEADARLALGDVERALQWDGEATRNLNLAAELYRASGYAEGEGYALRSLGNLARAQGENGRALTFYQAALAKFRSTGKPALLASTLQMIGELERWFGRVDNARGHYTEALQHYEQAGDSIGQANALLGLGLVESGPDPDLALAYFEDSASLYQQAGMDTASAMAREAARRLELDLGR